MAEIFLAYVEIKGKKKPVAIKRMLPQLAADKDLEEQFVAEAKLLEKLHHPNIIETIELGMHNGSLFIAMEYVFGSNLERLVRSCKAQGLKIPLNLLARIGADVCDVLGYIHSFKEKDGSELHFIHRDISPQNIMLSYSGQIKLMDFGVAKDIGTLSRTRPVALAGKVAYMSPEQVKQVPDLDLRTDIYSLGAVLFELSVGSRPFSASTELDTMLAIVKNPLPDLRDLDNEIPDEFAEIVSKAMDRDRHKRFQSTSEFRKALDDFLLHRNASVSPKDLAIFIRRVLPPPQKKKSTQQQDPVKSQAPRAQESNPTVQENKTARPVPHAEKESEAVKQETPIVLTKKIHRGPKPEILVPEEKRDEEADSKINLSESEMFSSIIQKPTPQKFNRLWVGALGLLAGCGIALLLYWHLSNNGPEQDSSVPIHSPVETKTRPTEVVPPQSVPKETQKEPGSSHPQVDKNSVDKNSSASPNYPALGHKNKLSPMKKKPGHKLRPGHSLVKPLLKTQDQALEPEIEVELDTEDRPSDSQASDAGIKKPSSGNEKVPQAQGQRVASGPEEKSTKDENAEDKNIEATQKQAPSFTSAKDTSSKAQLQALPKPSYQAPDVVAKRRIAGQEPQYPPMAKKAKLRATVLVKIHINPDGRVGFMKILKGHPLFNDAVTKAIKTWIFSPYTINGRPVGTYTVYKFVFQID